MTAGPLPDRSYAIFVPSEEVTVLIASPPGKSTARAGAPQPRAAGPPGRHSRRRGPAGAAPGGAGERSLRPCDRVHVLSSVGPEAEGLRRALRAIFPLDEATSGEERDRQIRYSFRNHVFSIHLRCRPPHTALTPRRTGPTIRRDPSAADSPMALASQIR